MTSANKVMRSISAKIRRAAQAEEAQKTKGPPVRMGPFVIKMNYYKFIVL
jgi:hypothetical protein